MVLPALRLTRSVVAGVAIHRDRVLLLRGGLPGDEHAWWHVPTVPLHLGERARDRVGDAFRDAVGCDAAVGALMGVSQRAFGIAGVEGREIVFQYLVRLVDPSPLVLPRDGGPGARDDLAWLPLAEVVAGTCRVAPAGCEERLVAWINAQAAAPRGAIVAD